MRWVSKLETMTLKVRLEGHQITDNAGQQIPSSGPKPVCWIPICIHTTSPASKLLKTSVPLLRMQTNSVCQMAGQ